MADRSLAQKSRQDAEHRSGGQYAKTNPCELCDQVRGQPAYVLKKWASQ